MLNFNLRHMKKIFNYCFLTLLFFLIESCDSGFDELNTSKTQSTTLDPALILNNAILSSSPTTSLNYEIAIVQQVYSSNTGVLEGGNFNKTNVGNTPLNWVRFYTNVIKYTSDVITRTKDDATRPNLYHMARIIQANAFMILTDTYGDIPYTEAGAGITGVFFPQYETQQSIYPKLIQELTEATAALDASKKVETSVFLYSGNIAQWKKFGYSLLLRAGMHLTKADVAKAQSTVVAAFNGGVILTNADNAIIRHDGSNNNGIGGTLTSTEAANYYLGRPFVDFLKNSSDPRLPAIAVRYVGATSGSTQTAAVANRTAAQQFGLKVGATDGSAQTDAVNEGLGSRYAYSQVDRTRIVKTTSPMFLVTAGQTNLLLAEATHRGWIAGGFTQAAIYFKDGITAHMNQMADYDAGSAISGTAISDYFLISANNLTATTELKQIGEQYWVASFLHGPEAWVNFRRTGFPVLTANPFVGDPDVTGLFINRIKYPPTEGAVNKANYEAAVAIQGADLLSTKMWLFK
jgi:hypothetical protein